MKKFYLSFLTAVFMSFSFSQHGYAQQIESRQALDLVAGNSTFLNLTKEDVQNSVIARAYLDKTSQLQLIYLQQSYNEVPVYNAVQVIALKNGQAVSVTGSRIYNINEKAGNEKSVALLSALQATFHAAKSVNISTASLQKNQLSVLKSSPDKQKVEFSESAISKENITADLLWVPAEDGKVYLTWQVKILPVSTSDYWLIMVNAKDGSIVKKENLTSNCNWEAPERGRQVPGPSLAKRWQHDLLHDHKNEGTFDVAPFAVNSANYRVIPFPAESMNHTGGAPIVVNNPWQFAGPGNPATTLNWQSDGTNEYIYTRGNNVWAREDVSGSNGVGASATSTTTLPNLNFSFPYNANTQPGDGDNQKFAITNLFYWNNIVHDISYQYGFDEVSGNFQTNNLNRGGAPNDAVIAEAQDGSGMNNANFSVGADGFAPRMQMYLWESNPYLKLSINTPVEAAGYVASIEGAMSTQNLLRNVGPVTGNLVLYLDNGATTNQACGVPSNAAALSGNIALIERGGCDFTIKVKNAQNAGAKAVIVINNVASELITMSGADNTITIPALMIYKEDGDALKSLMGSYVFNVTLKHNGDLDGDFDNGIIAHEYAHGISNRLTGGPAIPTCLQNSEQMGEGWSDYYALMLITNWATATTTDGAKPRTIGTYAMGEDPLTGIGIRDYPYSTNMTINPLTYANVSAINPVSEHRVGEIWASALWDMTWNMIQMDGIHANLYNSSSSAGNISSMKLVTLALKLQPCSPGFLDGRDALLKADELLFNGKYKCAIWRAFARRGMGVNAQQGSSNNNTDQGEDFGVPNGAILKKTVDKIESAQNDILTYTFTITAQCTAINNYKIVDTLATNVTYVSGGDYNAGNRTVTFQIPSLSSLQSATFTLKVKVNTGSYYAGSTQFSETVAANVVPLTLTATTNNGTLNWAPSTTNRSAPYSLKTATTSLASEQVLSSLLGYPVVGHTQLSFWQRYNTEASKDGGIVELSINNGSTWFDAAPYIAVNGYNTTINTNSSLSGKRAYSGVNNTWTQTVVNLSAFQNQSVRFRFRFVTDNAGSSNGWYVDDIAISKTPAVYNVAKVLTNINIVQHISDTITAITASVLPLSWGSFTAEKAGLSALLKWNTLQETNTRQFIIERSGDGVQFSPVGTLDAAGNSTTNIDYSFTDALPLPGINLYRILQTDLDGKAVYSETRSLNFDELRNNLVTISPNPAKNDVVIKVGGNNSVLKVNVLNASGQVLKSFTMKKETYRLNVSLFAAGVYYIKITGDNFSSIKKMIREK